jgi:hypothetical protein
MELQFGENTQIRRRAASLSRHELLCLCSRRVEVWSLWSLWSQNGGYYTTKYTKACWGNSGLFELDPTTLSWHDWPEKSSSRRQGFRAFMAWRISNQPSSVSSSKAKAKMEITFLPSPTVGMFGIDMGHLNSPAANARHHVLPVGERK